MAFRVDQLTFAVQPDKNADDGTVIQRLSIAGWPYRKTVTW